MHVVATYHPRKGWHRSSGGGKKGYGRKGHGKGRRPVPIPSAPCHIIPPRPQLRPTTPPSGNALPTQMGNGQWLHALIFFPNHALPQAPEEIPPEEDSLVALENMTAYIFNSVQCAVMGINYYMHACYASPSPFRKLRRLSPRRHFQLQGPSQCPWARDLQGEIQRAARHHLQLWVLRPKLQALGLELKYDGSLKFYPVISCRCIKS